MNLAVFPLINADTKFVSVNEAGHSWRSAAQRGQERTCQSVVRLSLFGERACRFSACLVVALFWTDDAHAQRIPVEFVWSAGLGLLAPFIAVPIKVGIIRLFKGDLAGFRPWILSLIEWVIWFPVGFVLLRMSDANLVLMVVPALLALSGWLHRTWIANSSWTIAVLLCFVTPLMIVALPLLAVVTIAYVQSLLA